MTFCCLNRDIDELFYERCYRNPRWRIEDSDFGIITASDDRAFSGLQLLYYSLHLSHELPLVVFDIGLTHDQQAWCRNQADLRLFPFHTLNEDSAIPTSVEMWQSWNKPLYIVAAPFRRTLWIDSDCMIFGNLNPLAHRLKECPLLVRDFFAPYNILNNSPELYERLPVENPTISILANAGVLGFDKVRDRSLLDDWLRCIDLAFTDEVVARSIRWHDQGALNWAIQKHNLVGKIVLDHTWNEPAEFDHHVDGVTTLLQRYNNCHGGVIVHFAGQPKPWSKWETGVPIQGKMSHTWDAESALGTLRVFVHWHEDEMLRKVRKRTYLQTVNLAELEIGEFQQNMLAENRVFLAEYLWKGLQTDYIGFMSASWDEKYHSLVKLHEIHKLPLAPGTVWCGGMSDSADWARESNKHHPGMYALLEEMAAVAGMSLSAGPTICESNFICHRCVFDDFLAMWRRVFDHFYQKYGYDLPFLEGCREDWRSGRFDRRKREAYFYERITMLYFSNRHDLDFKIPHLNEIHCQGCPKQQ